MFAKLYGEGDDQVLVTKGENDAGDPAVIVKFEVPGIGAAEVFLGFNDEEGMDKGFDNMSGETALKIRDHNLGSGPLKLLMDSANE